MQTEQYIPLDALAARLGLPKTYLKRLADENRLPMLSVNGSRRFLESAVQKVLNEMAAEALNHAG